LVSISLKKIAIAKPVHKIANKLAEIKLFNVMFETSVDVDWNGDPSDLSEKSFKQYNEAKKIKYKW